MRSQSPMTLVLAALVTTLVAGCAAGAASPSAQSLPASPAPALSAEPSSRSQPTPAPSAARTAPPVYDAAEDMIAGTCFDPIYDKDDGALLAVQPVVCSTPHTMELFARPLLSASPGVAWPGDDKINDEAEAACDRAFLDYVGIAYDDSAYRVTYFTPFEASWVQNDDRLVLCTVEARALAPFMQSVRGSRR